MNIIINDVDMFKSAFKKIDVLTDTLDFVCTNEEGIKCQLLDKSHIMFVKYHFSKEFFEEYELDNDDKFSIAADEFLKVLKKCKGNELILEFGEDLKIRNGSKTFTLRLVENDAAIPDLPMLRYTYKVNVPITFWKESLSDCQLFETDVHITTNEEGVIISDSGMMGEYSNIYYENGLDNTHSKFNIEKLDLLDSRKISDNITLKGGDDMPILCEVENPIGVLMSWLLAPKIDEGG